jgi:metal-responsive CopG/Arc/MetJ family transcriptional regulator
MTVKTRRRGAASKKVTISLPEDLFKQLEKMRRAKKLDRSTWVQEAVSDAIKRERRAEMDRAYVESYRNDPEEVDEKEIAMLASLAAASWADLDE